MYRAHSVLGQAIRQAIALGLHLRISTGTISDLENQRRLKLWNSLYSLEVLLSSMTGRPKCVSFSDVTVPRDVFQRSRPGPGLVSMGRNWPSSWMDSHTVWLEYLGADRLLAVNFAGGSVDWTSFTSVGLGPSRSHFIASLQLCHISDDVGKRLYSAGSEQTWFDVQNTIRDLGSRLREWRNRLPQELRKEYVGLTEFDGRSRLELSTSFHSLSMTLYRPCLCEIKIDGESPQSHKFNRDCAKSCVEAALHMVDMLPDTPIGHQVFQVFPWWALLHYTCQAAAVLLLELCLNMQHMPATAGTVMLGLRKALHHLFGLSENSKSALKAWNTLQPLFEKAVQQYSGPEIG